MSHDRCDDEIDGVALIQDPYEVDVLDQDDGVGVAPYFLFDCPASSMSTL